MKPSPIAPTKVVAVLVAAFVLLGCEVPSITATEDVPPTLAVAPATTQPDLVSVTNLVEAPVAPPIKLSAALQEIAKLAQSGVGDEVILAFIKNFPSEFSPTPDEILYLTDIGVSDVVMTALVNHHPNQAPAAPPTETFSSIPGPVQIPAPPAPEPTYNPEPPLVESGPEYPAPMEDYNPPPVVEYNYFYTTLAPYGSWVTFGDYGWCWQPTVAVTHHGWQPYCDRGRWVYTDCGYYWQSEYSWGWAPFHYGRWFHHPAHGWCWKPDSVWAPAWVSWRYADSYCGWAPLPPGAHYHAGLGFTYYGAHVGANFGFGLHRDAWTFVPAHQLHDPEVWRHRLAPHEVANFYQRTTVVNNYVTDNHNTIVNHGIGHERVPALARAEVAKVSVRETIAATTGRVQPDRLHQEGAQLVLYRPKLPVSHFQNTTEPGKSGAEGARPIGSIPNAGPPRASNDPKRPIRALDGSQTAPSSEALAKIESQPYRGFDGFAAKPVGSVPGTIQPSAAPSTPLMQQPKPANSPNPFQNRMNGNSVNPAYQRWTPAPPQNVPSAAQMYRQELPKPPAPIAQERFTTAPSATAPAYQAQRFEQAPRSPVQFSNPAYPIPSQPNYQPGYAAPSREFQGYSGPTYSAPAVQSRPAPSVPVPSTAPVRQAPQAVQAPTQAVRRQN